VVVLKDSYIFNMKRIYLDHTATTPLDPRVSAAMQPYFADEFGNPSSVHSFGQRARAALDESRDRLSRLLGARNSELCFVSSGTEADNHAIKGVAWKMRERGKFHIITSSAEHHAVLESCSYLQDNGFRVTYLPVDKYGIIDPDDLRRSIQPDTGLVTVMHANNEVGSLNPIRSIGIITKERGIVFHTDAVQSFGKIPVDVDDLCVDLLSISSHKMYGPKGIGAIYIRKGTELERLLHGGGQERGRRAGTENVPFAVGFSEAACHMCEEREKEYVRLQSIKDKLRLFIGKELPFVIVNGHPVNSLPHILSISFDSHEIDVDGEALLFNLDLAGIAVASGSACTSGSIEASHVLLAMGRDVQTARATIRFSPGRSTSEEDLEYTIKTLSEIVRRISLLKT
jgi:cysteine desulfurase